MDRWRRGNVNGFWATGTNDQQPSERMPGHRSPMAARAFVRLHWARMVVWLLLLLGFAVQLVVVSMVWELVDLSVSLMEVWAELARKHLEITLS